MGLSSDLTAWRREARSRALALVVRTPRDPLALVPTLRRVMADLIYGMMVYSVAQRGREIGLRLALELVNATIPNQPAEARSRPNY